MPDGNTHFAIGVIGGVTLTALAWLYTDRQTTIAVATGTLIGLWIEPDLDQDGRTRSEGQLRRIPVIGYLFQWSWYPYATLFRHRGWSHHIVIGTLSRVAYSAILLLVWASIAIGVGWLYDGQPRNWVDDVARPLAQAVNGSVLFAWWFQDALHVLADTVVSAVK